MVKDFFKIEKGKMYFTGQYMEAYIQANLFDKGLNTIMGEKVNILGLFAFRVGKDEKDIEKKKLSTFNLTNIIDTIPSKVEKKEIEIVKGEGIKNYYILKYNQGDIVVDNTMVLPSVDNEERLVSMLLAGGIPPSIKYSDLPDIILNNFDINGKVNVQAVTISVMMANLYRYNKDLSIPFRKVIGAGKASEYDYKLLDARTVCANDSTFAALTFEDKDLMLASSVVRKRKNKQQNKSAVEKIIDCY